MDKKQLIAMYKRMGDPDYTDTDYEYITALFTFLYNLFCCSSHAFSMFDTNGDGTIDFSEFVLTYSLLQRTDLASRLELVFGM
jgi:hypothetical protein